jgi:hypothetical protein
MEKLFVNMYCKLAAYHVGISLQEKGKMRYSMTKIVSGRSTPSWHS